jgi:hypothetical protein|tara:strand:+ start:25 stop:438 length:414 start_codon:yes stop_codon:yes gene_type:complete
MTKKELVKIIQEAVKREVQKEVKKIFINEGTQPQRKSKKEKTYVKGNKSLNDILNETVGLTKGPREEYPTLGGGTFDSNRMSELVGYGATEETKRDMVAVDTLQKAGKRVTDVPEHITNALTKDYSAVMKAMESKKK